MFSLDEARYVLSCGSSHIKISVDGHATPFAGGGKLPAVAMVRPVSDALKRVSAGGLIEGSVDRDQVWIAGEFVVAAKVVRDLDEDLGTVDAFYEAVEAIGFDWEVNPSSSDL